MYLLHPPSISIAKTRHPKVGFQGSPLEQSAASWFDHQETSPRNHQHMERTPGAVHRLWMAPSFLPLPSCTVRGPEHLLNKSNNCCTWKTKLMFVLRSFNLTSLLQCSTHLLECFRISQGCPGISCPGAATSMSLPVEM